MRVRSSTELGSLLGFEVRSGRKDFSYPSCMWSRVGEGRSGKVGAVFRVTMEMWSRRSTPLWVALGRQEHKGLLQFVVLLLVRRW